tara:strand:- start:43685 stop:45886 length:2202 start_codon:yes stop_codon:yes gene_type:complete
MSKINISVHKIVSIYSLKKKIKNKIPQKFLNEIDFGVLCNSAKHKDTLFIYLDTTEENSIGIVKDDELNKMYSILRKNNDKNTIGISVYGMKNDYGDNTKTVTEKFNKDRDKLKNKIQRGYKTSNGDSIYFKNIYIYVLPQKENEANDESKNIQLDFTIFNKQTFTFPKMKAGNTMTKNKEDISDLFNIRGDTYANNQKTIQTTFKDVIYEIKVTNFDSRNIIYPKYFEKKMTINDLETHYNENFTKEDKETRNKFLQLFDTYIIEKETAIQKIEKDLLKYFKKIIINIKEYQIDKEDIDDDTTPLLDPKKTKYNINDKVHISYDTSIIKKDLINKLRPKNYSILLKYNDSTTINGQIIGYEENYGFRIKNLDNSIKDNDDNKIIIVTFEDNGLFNDSNGKQGTYELFISDMKIISVLFQDKKWEYVISKGEKIMQTITIKDKKVKANGNIFQAIKLKDKTNGSVIEDAYLQGKITLQSVYNKLPKEESLVSSVPYLITHSFNNIPIEDFTKSVTLSYNKKYTPFYFDPRLIVNPSDIKKSNYFESKDKIENSDYASVYLNIMNMQKCIRLVSEYKTMKEYSHTIKDSDLNKIKKILCKLLFYTGAPYKSRIIVDHELIENEEETTKDEEETTKDEEKTTKDEIMINIHLTTSSDPDIKKHPGKANCKYKRKDLKKWIRKLTADVPFLQFFTIGGNKTKRKYNKTKIYRKKKRKSYIKRRTRRRRNKSIRRRI